MIIFIIVFDLIKIFFLLLLDFDWNDKFID